MAGEPPPSVDYSRDIHNTLLNDYYYSPPVWPYCASTLIIDNWTSHPFHASFSFDLYLSVSRILICIIVDQCGAEFSIINNDDLGVFLEAEELFENVVRVEISGVNRESVQKRVDAEVETPPKKVRLEDQQASPAPSTSPTAQVKAVHPDVVCDCCDELIFGFRYKCTECYNFDLCMACEGKMRHQDHVMLRIPSPLKYVLPPTLTALRGRCSRKHPETALPDVESEKSRRHHGHGKRHHRRAHRNPANLFDGFFRQLNEDSTVSDGEPVLRETAATAAGETPAKDTTAPQPNPQMPQPVYDFHKLVKVVEAVAGNVSKLFDPLGVSMDSYAQYGNTVPQTTAATPEKPQPEKPEDVQSPSKEQTEKAAAEVREMSVEKETTPTSEITPEPTIIDVMDDTSNPFIHATTETTPMSPNQSNDSDGK